MTVERLAVRVPVGEHDRHWSTRLGCRSVLVLAPHLVALTRLLDLLQLLEREHRVQVIVTVPDDETWELTHHFVARLGLVVLPWHQARRMRFDLVLAASTRGVDEVAGPVLLVPHGGGLGQYRPWRPPSTGRQRQPITGLDAGQLLWEGQVRAEAIALTHDDELRLLAQRCPQALPSAVVTGDIAFDRLVASAGLRTLFRHALGVAPWQKLVVITSSWSPRSAFGRHPDLFERVLAQLDPRRYRVVGALHPQIWSQHGPWQVRSWLAGSLRAGLGLLATPDGWRAATCAADHLMGDYGSATVFGAGFGVPTLLITDGGEPLLPGSAAAELFRRAPRWNPTQPLVAQLGDALAVRDVVQGPVRARLTSRPGRAAAILRREMYRLLELPEPARAAVVGPVPVPRLFAG